jgi:hypothetical protein
VLACDFSVRMVRGITLMVVCAKGLHTFAGAWQSWSVLLVPLFRYKFGTTEGEKRMAIAELSERQESTYMVS